jgi:hypothetical protein
MNERIKALLLNERNMFVNGVTESNNKIYIHGSEENLEKFAELIVRECIRIVEKNESEMHYDNGMYPVYLTVCEIREHFGVEE